MLAEPTEFKITKLTKQDLRWLIESVHYYRKERGNCK